MPTKILSTIKPQFFSFIDTFCDIVINHCINMFGKCVAVVGYNITASKRKVLVIGILPLSSIF